MSDEQELRDPEPGGLPPWNADMTGGIGDPDPTAGQSNEEGWDDQPTPEPPPFASPEELAEALARAEALRRREDQELEWCSKHEALTQAQKEARRRGLPHDVDPEKLSRTGWGVIFARGADPRIEHALQPLLRLRERQAGRRYKRFNLRPGQSSQGFLWHDCGLAPGVVNLDRVPYYLLIVGDPESIPFRFQYLLNLDHAVGRLHFDDPEDYRRYADAVVAAETRGTTVEKRAAFFSVENQGDRTTARMAEHLVPPLREKLKEHSAGWEVELWDQDRSYKKDFERLLEGGRPPGLLLVSAHGASYPTGHPDQPRYQGAPICRDWPDAPGKLGTEPRHFFAGDDLAPEERARIHGLVTYLFSCYGAGTPVEDSFPHENGDERKFGELRTIALKPFVSRLGQRLLAEGALAVIGNVDRSWTTSFSWTAFGRHVDATRTLQDALDQMLDGRPIGHALDPLYRSYGTISAQLSDAWDDVLRKRQPPEEKLAFLWTAHNTARNLVLLGDPAVRVLGNGGG